MKEKRRIGRIRFFFFDEKRLTGWGFILTMVFYKSKSLIPCIIAHAMIDVFSVFGAENRLVDQIYILATVIVVVRVG